MIKCGNCGERHVSVAEVRECYEGPDDAGLIYAEAFSSWVSSGGAKEDGHLYASTIARGEVWNGGISELPDLGECEHGLSAANCYGPQHYYFDAEEQARGLVNW